MAASVLELFSISKDNRSSVDEGSPGQRDSLFSSPEPEGSTMDSDTSITSATDKHGEAATLSTWTVTIGQDKAKIKVRMQDHSPQLSILMCNRRSHSLRGRRIRW